MPARPSSPGAAIAPGRLASLLAVAVLLLAFPFGPAPARAASTVVFGPFVAGGSQAIDVELPLALSIASVPASYDGVVLFTTADPVLIIGFGAFGFSMPITVGQLRTQFPAATIAFPAPTVAFDNPGGGFALGTLADLLYPLVATFVGGFLVVDLQGTAAAAPAASATVAVPGVSGAAVIGLSALLALVAAMALRSRRTADAASLRGRCEIGPP